MERQFAKMVITTQKDQGTMINSIPMCKRDLTIYLTTNQNKLTKEFNKNKKPSTRNRIVRKRNNIMHKERSKKEMRNQGQRSMQGKAGEVVTTTNKNYLFKHSKYRQMMNSLTEAKLTQIRQISNQ